MKIANIHEALTGAWHITDNSLPYLNEQGDSYKTERLAIKAARSSEQWTHRVANTGKIVKL
jgi:predicted lipoprotein